MSVEEDEDINLDNIDITDLANSMLGLLNVSKQVTEEDLYSDEFYILVFTALMSEEEIQLDPGNTPEEKIENINGIVNSLSSLIGNELPPIDAKKIVMKKDKENMKILVGLFYNLFQMIVQENLKMEEEKGDDEDPRSHSFNENRMNLSDKKETEKIRRNKDEEINLDNLESLELGKNKNKGKKKPKEENEDEKEQKSEEEKIIESNKKKQIKDDEDDEDNLNSNNKHSSNKKKTKSKHNEEIENSEDNNNNNIDIEKDSEDNNIEHIEDKKSSDKDLLDESSEDKKRQIIDSEKKSAKKKKSDDIPDLLEDDNQDDLNIIQKAKNQFEDIRNSEQTDSRLNNKAHSVSQSLPKLYNPNADEENDIENEGEMDSENYKENDDNEENEYDSDYNPDKKSKKTESVSNSNIKLENSSQKKYNKSNNYNDKNEMNIEKEDSKSNQQSTNKKKSSKKNTSTKMKEKETTNKKSSNKKEKENEQIKTEKKEGEEEVLDTAQKDGVGDGEKEIKSSQNNEDEDEEPLMEEEYKYEIMKQFKKIYGDKLDNIFLKQNLANSKNVFELALRNIKLAKQKMMKIENRIPEIDDLKTKEYLLKYERERQLMENYYNKEQKKLNYFEERAIQNFKQNIKDDQRAKEIEARKTENEIERRRKAQEIRNNHNQVKFCNEIYQRALELEKEKKIEKMKKMREQNRKENEEKREQMIRIENYYKDKIRILREVLENEKKQKEIEHRAHIQQISTLAREKRDEYRKKLENIFDRFDQEERKNEFERKNKKELNKIFDSYYGK